MSLSEAHVTKPEIGLSPAARMALLGAVLVIIYTALISSADGITKLVAGGYAAPQMFVISGLLVAGLSVLADRHPRQKLGLRTTQPVPMALRCAATVVASFCFFNSFRLLPFADVFVFVGIMPILAGLMSGPILGEPVRRAAWVALAAGAVGVMCLFPGGLHSLTAGHFYAGAAAVAGTFSMVMARLIGRYESNALAQVFYPNLTLALVMAVALPFVWKPIGLADLGLIAAYAGLLFVARWLLVIALRMLAAFAVTPLLNLQFVWMVLIGWFGFGEIPAAGTYLGVAIVIGSGLYLLWDQATPSGQAAVRLKPAE
ncbi:DMT family transporter [Chachezhania antarctica]|uniref:DMT family transporter n=1 Tax=Chachezhania antarctica TaxID=2340860 RepID=UPI001F097878|nr:DMT family transporter [Chachezhania antarctica]|tara:strand:+ start:1185 stop:2129 length:945 start_codon:yes stop_codon:yes gene_type:complete